MSDSYSPFVKFTYTILDLEGLPQQKSWLLNLSYVISIESGNNNDLKIFLNNNQIIEVELGRDYNAATLMNEILDFTGVIMKCIKAGKDIRIGIHVVSPEDIHNKIKPSIYFVLMVGHIRKPVGWFTGTFDENPVLALAKGRRFEPSSSF